MSLLHRSAIPALAALVLALSPVLVPPASAQDAGEPVTSDATGLQPSRLAPLAVESLILDAERLNGRMVAVGTRGHILLSDDGGSSWRQVPVPVESGLTAVDFIDEKRGWAVGHDSVVLTTEDAGETWTLQFAQPAWEMPLMDVLFTDARHGTAVGAYGLYLETADGGRTWTRRIIDPDEFHLNTIVSAGGDRRLMAGEFGGVYLSNDGGASWEKLDSPYEGSFFDALALGPDTFLVYGLQGNIFRTQDAGLNWTQVGMPEKVSAGLMGGTVLADGTIVLVGLQGVVMVSTDQGRSFTLRQREDRVALAEAAQAPDGDLILFGERGPLPVEQGANPTN